MSDMNGLNNALKNLNTYCQEQGSRLRETLSQQRPSNQSSPNSASSTPTSQPNGSSGAPSAPMSAPFPAPLPAPPQSVPRGVTRQGTGITVPRALPRLPTGHPPPVRPMGASSARVPRSAPPAGPPPQAPPPAIPPISKKTSLPSQPSKDGPKAPPTPRRLSADDRIFELDMEERRAKGYGMTRDEFRVHGKEMVEYITDYMENIHKRRVVPAIEPGYLKDLIPGEAPTGPESYADVMQDFEKYIMPGVTHWQHPRFHAYFPAGNSWPSILADMLSDALGCVGFSWAACPAMTELEMIMLEWFGKMIGLPESFLPFTEGAKGGGVIQSSASECNFTSLLAARFEVMKELRVRFPFVEEGLLLSKLIAYCSKEAHSSVEKACMIGMVKLRILETDSKFRLRGETLRNAIQEDRNLGLIPFFVSTTLGTTSCCSFDMLSEIGPVCEENELWLHVDAAYAGSAMICPEFRYLMDGIQYAMSFNTNPNKWLTVNFDCSTMWVKDRFKLTQALVVDPLYLQHSWMDKSIDYRHWGIPLSRRFRSLKLWFVIRMYGVEGLQNYVREHVRLAKKFEGLLRADPMMEIVGEVIMGLVCFRMKATEEANQLLLTRLNSSGRIHMVPASLNDRFVIRFCVCAENATDSDIQVAYDIISQMARHIMQESVAEPIVEEQELEQLEEQNYAEEEKEEKTRPPSRRMHLLSTELSWLKLNGGEGMRQRLQRCLSEGATLESMDGPPRPLERALSKEELLTKRHTESLAKKRSFLVRMVSDPKCYNPKIVRHLNMANHRKMSQDVYRDRTLMQTISHRPNHLSSTSSHSQSPGTTYPGCGFEHEEDDTVMPSSHTGLQTPI